MGRERHCKQISLVCVGSVRSVWTTLGLTQLTVACASRGYTAQALGCSAGALSKVGSAFHVLPRSKLLRFRFSGTLQGHRLGWVCILCPSQVRAAQATRYLVSALFPGAVHFITSPVPATRFPGWQRACPLRCAMCLFWGANLWLQPSRGC